MSQVFASVQTIDKDGEYRICAVRTSHDDVLSVYVNRVKKLSSDDIEVRGVLLLEAGDVVESTGDLTVE